MFDTYSATPPTAPLSFYSPLHLQQQPPGVPATYTTRKIPPLSLPVPKSSVPLEWAKPKPWYTPMSQTQL